MTSRLPRTLLSSALTLLIAVCLPTAASAQLTTYTDRAAWEAAVAAASSTVQPYDFSGLGLVSPDLTAANRVDQLDTDYAGRFRIVIDQLATSAFSNPGLDIFPDASCSLGSGDCEVFTFNIVAPAAPASISGPRVNRLIMPTPIVAFGGDFIQLGRTSPGPGSVTGPVTLRFGSTTIVVNSFLDGSGNGFFGFVSQVPATTIEFTYAKDPAGTLQNDIFNIYNPAFGEGPAGPAPAYGAVVRAVSRGEFGHEEDHVGGDIGVTWIGRGASSSRGTSGALGRVGGVCALPGLVTKECMAAGAYSGDYLGAARTMTFVSFRFGGAVPTNGYVRAILDGEFREAPFDLPSGFLTVGGSVLLLDASSFAQRLAAAGVPAGEFLLGAYTISDAVRVEDRFQETRVLLSSSLLSSGEEILRNNAAPSDTPVSVTVTTRQAFTFQPGHVYTVLLDAATSSTVEIFGPYSGVGTVDFLSTLAPAPVLFADEDGNPIPGFEKLGDQPSLPPPAAAVTLGPASATGQLDTTQSVTATARDAAGAAVPETFVRFVVASGPNAGVEGIVPTNAAGQASFTYTGGLGIGTDVVRASIGTLQSNSVDVTWTPPGALDHISLSPSNATIAAGGSQVFTVQAFDRFDYIRGDVTAASTLTISPNGSCSGASCTATAPGPHTVTATHEGKTATTTLSVTGPTAYTFTGFLAPIDNAPVVNTVKAGSALPIKFSLHGNQGLDIFSAGSPSSQAIACVTGVPEDQIEQVASAGASGLHYDPATDTYTYVWKSEKAWADKCRLLTVKLKDGSVHTALFKFR